MTLTKKDIVLKIAQETGVRQVEVKKVVQKTLDVIIDALAKGDKVELRNFGVFKVKSRKPKIGRNPRTGVTVPVPQRKVAVFKPGRIMKQRLRA
ncbi:MAG: integration host factor subunit beta [Candidatus Omnitrophica bacterium]|nr:integration host factor subunit beta [Candidatus Omnitrophota bacterium]MCM8798781.1 integration host factor subunit beta [Candidatus Omnitrophota bacterium]